MNDGPFIDFDGDGAGDDYTTDELGDGGTAYTSADGEVAVDSDGDGLIDELYTDSDGDGSLDTLMTDTDGDGYMDGSESYGGDPMAGESDAPASSTEASGGADDLPLGFLSGDSAPGAQGEEEGATDKSEGK